MKNPRLAKCSILANGAELVDISGEKAQFISSLNGHPHSYVYTVGCVEILLTFEHEPEPKKTVCQRVSDFFARAVTFLIRKMEY